MYGRKHIHRVAALLTAVAALAFFAGSVQAANSRPAGMTKAEHRALTLRSEALNERYGLGKWAGGPPSMSPAAYRALMLRSEALNQTYDLGGSKTASVAPAVAAGSGLAWGDFGIGAATMLAVVLVGIGVFFGSRHGRGSLRAHSSS